MRFPSGVIGVFDCGLRAHRQQMAQFKGTHGSLVVLSAFTPDKDKPTIIQQWNGENLTEHRLPPVDQYQLMAEDFADALLQGRQPRFPASDAVRNMQLLDQLYAAAG